MTAVAVRAQAPVRPDGNCVARFRKQVCAGGVPISRSSVAEWMTCPAKWAFQTVERQAQGPVSDELRLGRACHLVVATLLVARPAGDPETYVARALSGQRVLDHLLPSAVDWVLRADALVRQRGGSVVFVEQSIHTGIAGIQLSGRLDLVISGGSAAPLELVDWTFGRNPRFASVETMALNLGTSIYRTLLAVAMPERPDHVLVPDVHVPGRQVLSVELDRREVHRAFREIQAATGARSSAAAQPSISSGFSS
jgi:PD-(D/E)XK nuclease superfamily